jgi:hypothetical protein
MSSYPPLLETLALRFLKEQNNCVGKASRAMMDFILEKGDYLPDRVMQAAVREVIAAVKTEKAETAVLAMTLHSTCKV